jgi:hypothetical protein
MKTLIHGKLYAGVLTKTTKINAEYRKLLQWETLNWDSTVTSECIQYNMNFIVTI